jgi:ABC-type polysaccharide/polyol phosphate export permease
MTPIVYPISSIPEFMKSYLLLNPFVSFIESWRGIFFYNNVDNMMILESLFYTIAALIVAIILYKYNAKKVAEYV